MRRAILGSVLVLALLGPAPFARAQETPMTARAHLELGQSLAKEGKTEEARAHFREARKLGKGDEQVEREAEKALIALPPPPEPKAPAPAPAPPAKKPEPPKPAPETGPRAELLAQIEKLEAEKRELTKKAQDLEDQGKTAEAYQVRAEMDKKVQQIAAKKKELAGMPKGGPPQSKKELRQEKKEERRLEKENGERPKLMLRRKEELEGAARTALVRALEAMSQNRPHEAAAALAEHARLRHEAEQLGKKAESGKERVGLEERLRAAREAAAAAEKANNPDALKKARDEVAQAEKALHDFDSTTRDLDEKAQLERLAADMRRRGAPSFEIDERLGLAKRELQLDHEHRQAVSALQRDIDDKKVAEPDGKERLAKLDREHRKAIEHLREEGEQRVHDRAEKEMEKELARRTEELKKAGTPDLEVEQKIAALRREMEARLPGKKPEDKQAIAADGETKRERRVRELIEENKRLRKRVEDLEKENAALRAKKGAETASAPD